MGGSLPFFILGYHGCDAATAEKVLAGRDTLHASQNEYDWLGGGMYFWEHNAQRAFDFACELRDHPYRVKRKIAAPTVVGAVIDLGYCLNLLDSGFLRLVRRAYDELVSASHAANLPLPRNTGGRDLLKRDLDNAVIQMLHQNRQHKGLPPFDTVRAAYIEGEPLYENAGFAAKNHIQICVRDLRCIKGYFRVLDEDGRPVAFP